MVSIGSAKAPETPRDVKVGPKARIVTVEDSATIIPAIITPSPVPTYPRVEMLDKAEPLTELLEELSKSTARIGVEPAVAESPPIELQPANQLAEAAEEAKAPLYAAATKMLPGKATPAVKAGLVLFASL